MFEAPLTFTEAEAMLSARLDTPTALKHKEIAATWDADFRHRAFFSARVTEATVLSELHNRVQAVLDGKMTDKQAVALLRDYFVGPGADPLAKMGFAPKAGARTIAELASLPRLQLIVETNVRMAQECGHYQQWAESAAYYRYGVWRCGYAEEHREEHLARDGKVYAFDHPIWTQSPPGGEFNCHCYREIASEDEIGDMGLTPEPPSSPFEPSSLGFDPSRGMADPPPFGKRVRPEYREKAEEKMADINPTPAVPNPTPAVPNPTPAVQLRTPEEHAAKRREQWNRAYVNRLTKWKDELTSSGATDKVADELAKAYTPEAAKISKPPEIITDPLFSGAFLSQDGKELTIGGSLSDKKIIASVRKVVKDLPEKLKIGRQFGIDNLSRAEKEAKLLGADLIKGRHTRQEDLKNTNPNYTKGKEWQINCQRCVTTYEARRRGIDVTALPVVDKTNDFFKQFDSWTTAYKNAKLIQCSKSNTTADTVRDTKAKINSEIESMPDGARSIVMLCYGKRSHVFVAERIGGKTYFFDPQANGKPRQTDAKENFKGMSPWYAYVLRVDNLDLTDVAKVCATRR